MVPTLKIPRDRLFENGFINGYSKDALRDVKYEDAIYVLFRPLDLDRFREFLDSEYERTKQVIDDYDHPGGFVVVVYKLLIEFENDYKLVRLGKYSKTSKKFQDEFPKTIVIKKLGRESEQISLQFRIFNKTEDLVNYWEEMFDVSFDDKQELWEGWDDETETINKLKLEELCKQTTI